MVKDFGWYGWALLSRDLLSGPNPGQGCPRDSKTYPLHFLGSLLHTLLRKGLQVRSGYVEKGDMTWRKVEDLAVGALYRNSNHLYNLGLPEHRGCRPESASGPHIIRAQPSVNLPLRILEAYLANDRPIQYLRVYWNDMTGMTRMRAVHVDYVRERLKKTGEFFLGITTASLGFLQNDTLALGVKPVGEYKVYPD